MSLSIFLNTLGLCFGFLSAIFFSVGALAMTPAKIQKVAATYWDSNQHWGDSIADQRADYIVGALLLLLSFSLQLAATLIPQDVQLSLLQPLGFAIAEMLAVLVFLLVCSVLFRTAIAKSTRQSVRRMQTEKTAAEEQAAKNRVP